MERMLRDGDYVPDGAGGLETAEGAEEVLARVLFRLTARRGAMPFLPGLGSRLHEVIREKPGARQTLCARYVAQALEEEATASLAQAKAMHDRLEALYNPHVDFALVETRARRIAGELLARN